jgi:hypothetical protein
MQTEISSNISRLSLEFGGTAIVYIVDSSVFKFMKEPVRVVTEGIAI